VTVLVVLVVLVQLHAQLVLPLEQLVLQPPAMSSSTSARSKISKVSVSNCSSSSLSLD
jgi:hypothetical protein